MNEVILQTALAFFIGGIWLSLTTVIADKAGFKIGGFIAGLPSTIVLAYFFVAFVGSSHSILKSSEIFPLIYGFDALFVLSYLFFSNKGFYVGLASGLLVWAILAITFTISGGFGILVNSIIGLSVACICLSLVRRLITVRYKKIKVPFTFKTVIERALVGGSVIATATFLSKIGGSIFGGMMAAFPAMFLTTIIIVNKVHGLEATRQILINMFFSATITVNAYSFIARFSYPKFGLWIGTLIPILTSLLIAPVVFKYLLPQYLKSI